MSAEDTAKKKARETSLEGKKRYRKPELVDYGGIRALTATMGQDGALDGGFLAPKTFLVQ